MENQTSQRNPYGKEEKPELHDAWQEGYRAGLDGQTPPEGNVYDDEQRMVAWLDGYAVAQSSG